MSRSASTTTWCSRAALAAALALLVLIQAGLPLAHVVAHEAAHLASLHRDHDGSGRPSVAQRPTHLDEGACCFSVLGVAVDGPDARLAALPTATVLAAALDLPSTPPDARPRLDGRPRAPPLA